MNKQIKRKATETEAAMLRDLERCTFAVASFDKRFVRDVSSIVKSGGEITEKQAALIPTMHYRYRRQHRKSTPNYDPKSDPKAHRGYTEKKSAELAALQAWNEKAEK